MDKVWTPLNIFLLVLTMIVMIVTFKGIELDIGATNPGGADKSKPSKPKPKPKPKSESESEPPKSESEPSNPKSDSEPAKPKSEPAPAPASLPGGISTTSIQMYTCPTGSERPAIINTLKYHGMICE